ncbi:hypothetical protein [Brevibacillus sp. SYSU BS000544]|uniref:hypothetical protein n=1 Tax=Brevibacillus sp. SYSU BS000544 TaxID=3416443 RepID=UPI003CE5A9CF
MELHTHKEIENTLQQFINQALSVTYTQWDSEEADEEEVIDFNGTLKEVRITDNEFEEKDLFLLFTGDDGEIELLMEVPASEEDLGVLEGNQLRIFGTEAEIILIK